MGQLGAVQITTSHAAAPDDQLAYATHRNDAVSVIQDERNGTGHGPTDDVSAEGSDISQHDGINSRFRRAVVVVQLHSRQPLFQLTY
ncbi:MAG TPA: hypothetical protein VK364_14235 [Hymenobacter sp.]|nr:hypothetical protein [Hymenobacter sp.]